MNTKNYLNSYLIGSLHFPTGYNNNTAGNLLSATRETGEKLAASSGGSSFTQILAHENEKQRKTKRAMHNEQLIMHN